MKIIALLLIALGINAVFAMGTRRNFLGMQSSEYPPQTRACTDSLRSLHQHYWSAEAELRTAQTGVHYDSNYWMNFAAHDDADAQATMQHCEVHDLHQLAAITRDYIQKPADDHCTVSAFDNIRAQIDLMINNHNHQNQWNHWRKIIVDRDLAVYKEFMGHVFSYVYKHRLACNNASGDECLHDVIAIETQITGFTDHMTNTPEDHHWLRDHFMTALAAAQDIRHGHAGQCPHHLLNFSFLNNEFQHVLIRPDESQCVMDKKNNAHLAEWNENMAEADIHWGHDLGYIRLFHNHPGVAVHDSLAHRHAVVNHAMSVMRAMADTLNRWRAECE